MPTQMCLGMVLTTGFDCQISSSFLWDFMAHIRNNVGVDFLVLLMFLNIVLLVF